jgi:flagellar basal-body rod modification protein FlgD
MAALAQGIWSQISTHAPIAGPMDSTSSGSSSSGDSASISANDFLTLLVTEMQNQDPTADTDPNEYINQLVQVNSLEQLISINQTLTADSAGSTNSSAQTSPDAHASAGGRKSLELPFALQTDAPGYLPESASLGPVPGNLTVPRSDPAAVRVAQSLTSR